MFVRAMEELASWLAITVGLMILIPVSYIWIRDHRANKLADQQYNRDLNFTKILQVTKPDLERTIHTDIRKLQSGQDFEIGLEYVRSLEERLAMAQREPDSGNYTGKHEGSGKQVKQQDRVTRAKEETHTYGTATGHKGGRHKK